VALQGRRHRGVYRLWSGDEMVWTGCGWGAATGNPPDPTAQRRERGPPERGPSNPFLYLVVVMRGERLHSLACHGHEWAVRHEGARDERSHRLEVRQALLH
jgi:hypothetical protein